MDIISIAQQASPKAIGQIELRRAQFTTLSSWAKRIPSSLRKFSASCGVSSVTPLASSTAMRLLACEASRATSNYILHRTADNLQIIRYRRWRKKCDADLDQLGQPLQSILE